MEARVDGYLSKTISRFGEDGLSYKEFYWLYIQENCPALITGVPREWECSKSWIHRNCSKELDQPSAINFDYLKHKISNTLLTVTKCSEHCNENVTMEMGFHNFLDYWEKQIKCFDITNAKPSLYLKDWHLKAQLSSYEFYKVPAYFSSDWLNEYLIKHNRDDYRFVYMGPRNSWSPFHVDVFGSFSWSANIYGCKKWILLPPGEQYKISDRFGNITCNISEKCLSEKNVIFFVVYQQENETIFVPSGWYHQVWNITDTISVNHNWFNAANIKYIWCNLSKNLRKVIYEIKDFRNDCSFKEKCQEILRANFGLNISDFLDILCYISEARLNLHKGTLNMSNASKYDFNNNDLDIYNDIKNLHDLLKAMAQDKIVHNCPILYERCLKCIDINDNIFIERNNK